MILKWLALLAIVAAVWYGFRILSRRGGARRAEAGRGEGADGIEDLRACRTCGAYVADGQRGCGREKCPYPG